MGIININLEDLQEDYMIKFMRSVLEERAIADIRDGLKPVQRYCIWNEYDDNSLPNKPHVKCAMTVGGVIGKYSPHGDASAYAALMRLSQNFSVNIPMIEAHGNNGTINGDPPAAMRYVESRLSKYGLSLCDDINKNAVDFQPNYSNMFNEPTILPAKVCNLLIQGSLGIASGFISSIPPHNINDICDATIKLIKEPNTSKEYFAKNIKPDFPTGGIICNSSEIEKAYLTGKGNIKIRSHVEIKELKNGKSMIIIKDLPFLVTIGPRITPGLTNNDGGLINSIVAKIKDETIEGISDIQDHSKGMNINIEIYIKKDYDPNIILQKLYKYTKLESSYKIQLVCLNNKEYNYYSIKKILEEFIKFRKTTIRRTIVFDINNTKKRIHILEGLIIALKDIDSVIKIIKSSKDKEIAKINLKKKLNTLTNVQIDYILDMKLSSLTSLGINNLIEERKEKLLKVKEYIENLKDDSINKRIIEEQEEYKKLYGYPSKTEYSNINTDITEEDIIESEDCILAITMNDYIKRVPESSFKVQKRNTLGNNLKDEIKEIISTNTKDHLFCFTNTGRVFDTKVYKISACTMKNKGMKLPLNLKPNERIIKYLCVKDEDLSTNSSLLFITKNGLGKRTLLNEFKNINNSGIIAIDLKENDEIISANYINEKEEMQDVIIATKNGLVVRYDTLTQFKPIGRTAQGNLVMKLADNDYIINACIISDENDKIFFVTKSGLAKATEITDIVKKKDPNTKQIVNINDGFPRLKRSATIKGRIGISLKNDELVNISKITNSNNYCIVVTTKKVSNIDIEEFIKLPLKRPTIGKRLINIKDEDDYVVTTIIN